jgi:hypothetical protein
MPPIRPTPNRLLQTQPAAELEALVPRLGFVELVRETVLVEAGSPLTHVYLPHSGAINDGAPFGRTGGGSGDDRTRQRLRCRGRAWRRDIVDVSGCGAAGYGLGARRCGFSGGRSSKRHFPCNAGATRAGAARTGPPIRRMQCLALGRGTPGALAVARAIYAAAKRCR